MGDSADGFLASPTVEFLRADVPGFDNVLGIADDDRVVSEVHQSARAGRGRKPGSNGAAGGAAQACLRVPRRGDAREHE